MGRTGDKKDLMVNKGKKKAVVNGEEIKNEEDNYFRLFEEEECYNE